MIKIENVSCHYPGSDHPALVELSLSIHAGESVCVIGNNGSGKSTLAKLLAGVIEPDKGWICVDQKSSVGLLFENPDNQMVAMVVEKELAFSLENQAMPLDQMRRLIDNQITLFEISHLRHRLTTELSQGEKQCVALAAVSIAEPMVLVLDESDSFLDLPSRNLLEQHLLNLRRRQPDRVEIRISLNPDLALKYSRLLVLHEGRLVADGAPSEILADTKVRKCLSLIDDSIEPSLTAADELPLRFNTTDSVGCEEIGFENLSFGYDSQKKVLCDISMVVRRGEIVALIGPTGAGKSTIGLLLCGLLKADGLSANANGNGSAERSDRSSVVVTGSFQQPERQFFLSTCVEEIAFGPKNCGCELSESDLSGLFDLVGLPFTKFAKRDPFKLSMGEKRRLAFACAIALNSPFLVLDEPTAGLDLPGRRQFSILADRLRNDNRGILLITHDLRLVRNLADRVYLLKDGSHLSEISRGQLDGFSRMRT